MKIYLDDEREAPPGWHLVKTSDEAIELLNGGSVTEISLDHDLGDDRAGTGYDVILWIEKAVIEEGFIPPKIHPVFYTVFLTVFLSQLFAMKHLLFFSSPQF